MEIEKIKIKAKLFFIFLLTAMIISSCGESDNALAPYAGSPNMSSIILEDSTYTPKITWVGGYVTALGINRGSRAALDSTLVWLIYQPGNQIKYPVQFGSVPSGAQDLTQQFGGSPIAQLSEDSTYTIWVLKDEVWSQISSERNKVLYLDSSISSAVSVGPDTIKLSASNHVQVTKNLDNYIGISSFSAFGRLGTISISQTNTSNSIIISWTITQENVADSQIAAIGIVEGNQYHIDNAVWEVFSEDSVNGNIIYGKSNIISKPVMAGERINGTRIFVEFPAEGLKRDQGYYLWIAHKDWDGSGRLRVSAFYAYATFTTE